MEWHRFRGVHPPACTCVDCEERRKWRLPGALRSQQPPAAPPSKPPASREDLNRLRKTPSARSRQVPETPPAEPPATAEDIDQLRGSRSSPSDSPDDEAGSHHPIWCQCPTCIGVRRPKESPPEPPAATHDEERKRRRTPFSHHPPNCPCAGCEHFREQQRLESWGNDARPESDNSQGRGPRQAAPIRNLSPRPTDQTTQWPTPPQPSKPTEAQQEQQPQRGPRQTAPIRNLSPGLPGPAVQSSQRPTPLQPPTTSGARQRPQQSRRSPRGNNLLKLVIPAALAVAVLGCAILLLG